MRFSWYKPGCVRAWVVAWLKGELLVLDFGRLNRNLMGAPVFVSVLATVPVGDVVRRKNGASPLRRPEDDRPALPFGRVGDVDPRLSKTSGALLLTSTLRRGGRDEGDIGAPNSKEAVRSRRPPPTRGDSTAFVRKRGFSSAAWFSFKCSLNRLMAARLVRSAKRVHGFLPC